MRQDQNETGSGHDCKGDANAGATSRNQKARTHDTGPDVRGHSNPGAMEVMARKNPWRNKKDRAAIMRGIKLAAKKRKANRANPRKQND